MKRAVDNSVSKQWARLAKQLLTGSYQDITSLYTKLLTMTTAEQQELKTQAAQRRLRDAYAQLVESVKFGWMFGIRGHKGPLKPKIRKPTSRRLRALLPLAVEQGLSIGRRQLEGIRSRHASHLRVDAAEAPGVHHTAT